MEEPTSLRYHHLVRIPTSADTGIPMFKPTPVHLKTLLSVIFLLGACIEAEPFDASEDVTATPDVVAAPDATEPDVAEPDTTQPKDAGPDAAAPDATDPDATDPDATDPDATETDATDPDATGDTMTDTVADVPCEPTCGEKTCGDDGCGGVCGECSDAQECTGEGFCVDTCVPDCAGKECGDDGCGGTCGSGCPQDLPVCTDEGLCDEECTPECVNKNCGPDGCGGLCGNGPNEDGCYANKPHCNAGQMCQEACPEECPENCSEDGLACMTQVTFQFDASCNPDSTDPIKHVWVAGNFDSGDSGGGNWMDWPAYALKENPSGIYSVIMWLPVGEHSYRFVTSTTVASVENGTWETLSGDLECVETVMGSTNRSLSIYTTDPIMLPVVAKNSCWPCGQCTPDCAGKSCGGDGCGGTCGTCPSGSFCADDTKCMDTCVFDEDCDDYDPCTADECDQGACASFKFSAGTPCWVNAWCTDEGQCDGSPSMHQRHLASGPYHNCMIFVTSEGANAGLVKCWGSGSHGQLGHGAATSIGGSVSALPSSLNAIPLGIPALSVAAGTLHSCALLLNGELKCWGHANHGQLGQYLFTEDGVTYLGNLGDNGGEIQDLQAIDLGTEEGTTLLVDQVVAGNGFTCALLHNQRVKCFGLNDKGQLGNGTTENSADVSKLTVALGDDIAFVKLGDAPLENVNKIFAGDSHACAIDSSGHAYCWGDGSDSKLGAGLSLDAAENYATAAHQVLLGDPHVFELFLSQRHTCALVTGGSVKCWGYGGNGALGYESSQNQSDSLANMMYLEPVELGAGVVAHRLIQGALEHTCAIVVHEDDSLFTQQLKCWGNNGGGKLGLGLPATTAGAPNNIGDQPGEMGDGLPDAFLAEEVDVLQVSGGAGHTCAILETLNDGQKKGIKCWGHNGPSGKTGATGQPNSWILGVAEDEMGDSLPWVDLDWPPAKWINSLCEQDMCPESTP